MLGLLIIPVVVASIGSLTGGSTWIAAAAATNLYSRIKGYKHNEGPLTERACGIPYGVTFDTESEYEINRWLGRLGAALPAMFMMRKQSFDMTVSEAEFLKMMLYAAVEHFDDFDAAKILVMEENGSKESMDLLYAELDKLANDAILASNWLDQFPESRRRL